MYTEYSAKMALFSGFGISKFQPLKGLGVKALGQVSLSKVGASVIPAPIIRNAKDPNSFLMVGVGVSKTLAISPWHLAKPLIFLGFPYIPSTST